MTFEHENDDEFAEAVGRRMRRATEALRPSAASELSLDSRPRHHASRRMLGVAASLVLVVTTAAAAVLVLSNREDGRRAGSTPTEPPASETVATDSQPSATATDSVAPATDPAVVVGTPPPDPLDTLPVSNEGVTNFLIVGIDNSACVDPDSPFAGGIGDRAGMGERSDTMMILRLDPTSNTAAVLSFPRDLWVEIAGRQSKNRLNSAYVEDDPTRLIETIADNFAIGVDHFVQLDFCAFKVLVDAIGGVSVPFDRPVRDLHTGLDVPTAGCFAFDGDHALAYVRSRTIEYLADDGVWRSEDGSDLTRISRQQDFLNRTLASALDAGLTDPSVARAFIDVMTQHVVVDSSLTVSKILAFMGALAELGPGSISGLQIDATPNNISGNFVLVPNLETEHSRRVLAIFRGDAAIEPIPNPVDSASPQSPDASSPAGITPSPAVCG